MILKSQTKSSNKKNSRTHRRPKILVISSTFPRNKNDHINPNVLLLCNELSDRYEIFVLAPHEKGLIKFEEVDSIKVFREQYFFEKFERLAYGSGILSNLKKWPLNYLLLPFYFYYLVKAGVKISIDNDIKLIHAHWIIPSGLIAYIVSKKTKIPYIITAHGSDLNSLKSPIFSSLIKMIILNSAHCCGISNQLYKKLLKYRLENISLTYLGSPFNNFVKPVRKKVKKLLFVGRLVEMKGVETIVKAMPLLVEKHKDLKLTIVGEGPQQNNLINVAKKLNVENFIDFFGAKNRAELEGIYKNSDLLVFSSNKDEGLPTVLLEAGSFGLPVISTNVGGVSALITNNETGLIFKINDSVNLASKIETCIKDYSIPQKLGMNLQKLILKDFSWIKSSKQYDRIIKSHL